MMFSLSQRRDSRLIPLSGLTFPVKIISDEYTVPVKIREQVVGRRHFMSSISMDDTSYDSLN